jgi:hypothetical protein
MAFYHAWTFIFSPIKCDELLKIVVKIKQNREKNVVDVSEQKQIVKSKIQEVRTKINNHLDMLEEDLMKE